MKKIIFGGVFILIILAGLMSYAALIKEPISKDNLSDLKGNWEGWRSLTKGNFRTELEINNDTLPLKGKFTFHDVQRKGKMSGTNTMNFAKGKIKDGNFYLKQKGGAIEVELSLHKGDGKMKLKGSFDLEGNRGTMDLDKK
jgi:hypothetical protein